MSPSGTATRRLYIDSPVAEPWGFGSPRLEIHVTHFKLMEQWWVMQKMRRVKTRTQQRQMDFKNETTLPLNNLHEVVSALNTQTLVKVGCI